MEEKVKERLKIATADGMEFMINRITEAELLESRSKLASELMNLITESNRAYADTIINEIDEMLGEDEYDDWTITKVLSRLHDIRDKRSKITGDTK